MILLSEMPHTVPLERDKLEMSTREKVDLLFDSIEDTIVAFRKQLFSWYIYASLISMGYQSLRFLNTYYLKSNADLK